MKLRSISAAKRFLFTPSTTISSTKFLSTQSTTSQPSTSLKLIALPLSRSDPTSTTSPLFYLHAKRIPLESITNSSGQPISIPLSKKALNYAALQWSKLGDAKEGSYKRRAYVLGDKFMDKIEFEEWSLKGIDPALAPTPMERINHGADGVEKQRKEILGHVSLLYPPSLLSPTALLDTLKSQLSHREPHHKAAMWKCIFGAPLTFPFAIIPIVPNFPLFYVLWRAYSHYRAWKSSEYLNALISASQIELVPSSQLDTIYSPKTNPNQKEPELLLTLEKVPEIVKQFGLSEEEKGELRRAVVQAEQRLQSQQKTGKEE